MFGTRAIRWVSWCCHSANFARSNVRRVRCVHRFGCKTWLHWLHRAESFGVTEAVAEITAILAEGEVNAVDLTGFGREGPGY